MSDESKNLQPFSRWLRQPQTLIALSALLLSLCGLFISIYEASLIRKAQHASVWPHVEVSGRFNPDEIVMWAQNTGIGPARIQAAAISYDGQHLNNWSALIRKIMDEESDNSGMFQSLINGRVLPADSQETIFSLAVELGATPKSIARLRAEILNGTVDVTLCYCSVYEECWVASLQDVIERWSGNGAPGTRSVEACEKMESSGI